MTGPGRWVAPPAALFLLLAGCSGDGGGTGTAGTTATTAAPAPSATTATAGGTASTTALTTPGRVISAVVRNGSIVGGLRRERVEAGERIVVRVESDTADEVHVHGYNKRADVAAGGVVEIPFVADIKGVFEVELEERKLPVLELEVR